MSEFGPQKNGSFESKPLEVASDAAETQSMPRFDPTRYQQGVPGTPLPPIAEQGAGIQQEQPAEKTQKLPLITPGVPSFVETNLGATPDDQAGSTPWSNQLAAAVDRSKLDELAPEELADPTVLYQIEKTRGDQIFTGLRRAMGVVVVGAVVAAVVLGVSSLNDMRRNKKRDDAEPLPTLLPIVPTQAPPSETMIETPTPSPSQSFYIQPVPSSPRPSVSKTSPSPSPSKTSASPTASPTASAVATASPSEQVNTCESSPTAAEMAICMPRGGTAYAYEWPPEQQKTVYAIQHGQVVRPECVNDQGWVLADYGDQAGYVQPGYFKGDDLAKIAPCAN